MTQHNNTTQDAPTQDTQAQTQDTTQAEDTRQNMEHVKIDSYNKIEGIINKLELIEKEWETKEYTIMYIDMAIRNLYKVLEDMEG